MADAQDAMLADIDEQIARSKRVLKLAKECGLKSQADEIRNSLREIREWRAVYVRATSIH